MEKKTVFVILAILFAVFGAASLSQITSDPWKKFLVVKSGTAGESFKTADVDGDGTAEKFELKKGRLTAWQNENKIWQSPQEWWVDSFVLADSTRDGKTDINISVWKAGSFGRHKPFWFKGTDDKIENHFFVFSVKGSQIFPLWQSSALARPNCIVKIISTGTPVSNFLYAEEGVYETDFSCAPKTRSLWKWNGWGFTRESSEILY